MFNSFLLSTEKAFPKIYKEDSRLRRLVFTTSGVLTLILFHSKPQENDRECKYVLLSVKNM